MNTYYYNTTVRIQGSWTQGSVASDPDTVTFKITDPDNVTTTYVYGTNDELIKVSTGIYRVDINLNKEGIWYYRWEGTGSVQSSFENILEVLRSSFIS